MAFERRKPAAIGTKASYPGFIEPALVITIEKVPSGERWVHEIKFDGYRVQVHLRDAAVANDHGSVVCHLNTVATAKIAMLRITIAAARPSGR